jgi:hypothetical protein
MPTPYPKAHRYPGQGWTLRQAAEMGQLVRVRCNLCHRGATYLASDLVQVLGPNRDARAAPFPCGKCRKVEYIEVRLSLPEPADYGVLMVRRPRRQERLIWRNERLGDADTRRP